MHVNAQQTASQRPKKKTFDKGFNSSTHSTPIRPMSFDHHLFGGSEAWEKALLIDDDISESMGMCGKGG